MPLLELEPCLYPEDLLRREGGAGEVGARWWVLHTRPRAEKALARRFFNRALPFYLPLYCKEWRKSGRRFRSYVPLFPGYLFLLGDNQVRLAALETNLVAGILPVSDQDRLRDDLARVHQLTSSGALVAPEDRLVPGTWVEIVEGPLVGLRGQILRRGKQLRFFVEVRLLQRGVSVEIERHMIEPLGPDGPAVGSGGTADLSRDGAA